MLFKAQLFALTGVQPQSQKVMLKGALLKDDPSGWNALKPKLKNGVTLLMMGTKDEDALVTLKESEKPQVMTGSSCDFVKYLFDLFGKLLVPYNQSKVYSLFWAVS